MEYLSKNVNQFFKFINKESQRYINNYYLACLTRKYKIYNNNKLTNNSSEYSNLELEIIREYSGYCYKNINNALRNIWNYEENGNINKKDDYLKRAHILSEIIRNKPTKLGDFKTYRGVNISYFKEYGIKEVKDLINLKGQFLLDNGFISTSIYEDRCFFKKENELGINYNVKITYLIPEEFNDGILLIGNMSYNEGQKEYLINTGNLAKVIDVIINSDNTAIITAMIIPKMIYDEYYSHTISNKVK